jgi:hypothetical protein
VGRIHGKAVGGGVGLRRLVIMLWPQKRFNKIIRTGMEWSLVIEPVVTKKN